MQRTGGEICKAPDGGSWPIFPIAHKKVINYWATRYETFAVVLQRASALHSPDNCSDPAKRLQARKK